MTNTATETAKLRQLIHIAKSQLNMDEETYRAALLSTGGADSSKKMGLPALHRVLEHFKRSGFKPKASPNTRRPNRPTPAQDKLPLIRRIRAQLISLNRKPDAYADGIARQMFGAHIQFYEWCDHQQLHKVSTALGYEQARKGATRDVGK